MKRNRFKITNFKYYNIVFSILLGISLSATLIILFGYAGTKVDFAPVIISIMLYLSLSSGGLLSGYIYGKKKRRGGIKGGLLCGAIIYAVLFAFGIFYMGKIPPLRLTRYFIVLCISGAVGGIAGVNSRIKRPPA